MNAYEKGESVARCLASTIPIEIPPDDLYKIAESIFAISEISPVNLQQRAEFYRGFARGYIMINLLPSSKGDDFHGYSSPN